MLMQLFAAAALLGATLEDPIDDGVRLLRHAYPDARARGVRKLAKLGTPEAWARVRRALEDPEPQVADAAQRAMAGVRDARVLARWLGREGLRDRDEWVRLRVAQVAGAVELPVEVRDLADLLTPREVALSRALCASLEAQAHAGRLVGGLERAEDALVTLQQRARDPHLRADSLAALVALDPGQAARRLVGALEERDPLLRAAALRLSSGAGSFGLAARHLADPDPRVRLACLEHVIAARDRAMVEVLVQRLEEEPRLRLRERGLAALRDASGLKHGADPRPWRRWLTGLPGDWTPADESEGEGPRTTSTLGRLPLPSDRLCILVDLSGSLWAEREGGRSRKALLDDALRDLLERMPSDASFNLVPYATDPDPWRSSLVPATPANVKDALRTFERSRMTGKGNVWDALAIALDDPAVDTVLIVSDGAPTGGRRWDLFLMAELIERERRWSGVAVSTVLVDASRRLELRWADVARRTGGSSVSVAFEGE